LNTYEAMFLFDSTFATDFSRVEREVSRLMERAGAEIVLCRKWDERKLAYDIKGRKRGCYVLTFFRAGSDKINGIERDAQLSESVLRMLILRADHMTLEDMEAACPTRAAPATPPADQAKDASEQPPAAAAAPEEPAPAPGAGGEAATGAESPAVESPTPDAAPVESPEDAPSAASADTPPSEEPAEQTD
jgi:small subunit ribosomal protein S6